jgi:uncharacterized cupin superfamily protein
MQRVAVEDVEPESSGVERRRLSELLGTTDVAVNHYRLAPGEGFPAGLHAHADQEEVFVVLSGEATFETLVPADGDGEDAWEAREVTVAAVEAVRFPPGEFQSGQNRDDTELVALALGAPKESDDVRLPLDCPECGRRDVRLDVRADGLRFVCLDCGDERVPADCPDCGHDDLRVTLGDGTRTVVVCQGCGATFDDPPVRDDG